MTAEESDALCVASPEVSLNRDLERQTIKCLSRRVLPIMFLLYFFACLDRISLGFAQLKMGIDLSLDPALFGLASGIFFAGYILLEIPSSLALERFGAKIWMTRIGITWGLLTLLTAFVQNETQLIVVRFLLGCAEAGLAPGVVLFAMRLYPQQHRAKATASIIVASPVAGALAGPICGLILDHAYWLGISSWRWLFVLTGIPAILLGVVTYTLLTDRPEEARWLSAEQRGWLINAVSAEPSVSHTRGREVLATLRNPNVLLLGLVQFLTASGAYALAFWSPQIVKGLTGGFSASVIGLLVFIPYSVAAIALYVNGAHSDRTGERTFHSGILQLVGGIALLAVPIVSGDPILAFLALIVATMGTIAYAAPFWGISQELFAGVGASVAVATVMSLGQFGGLLSPYIFGVITGATGSTSSSVTFLGVLVVAAGATLILFRKRWES